MCMEKRSTNGNSSSIHGNSQVKNNNEKQKNSVFMWNINI
jgi:hypothetical protein